MDIFYKFIRQNSKTIALGLFLIAIHGVGIQLLKDKAILHEEIAQIKPLHYKIQSGLFFNLSENCDYERNSKFKENLDRFALQGGLSYIVNKTRLLKIDDLLFSQIFLVTSKLDKNEVNFSSSGYLIENTQNKNCFGLI